MRTVRRLTKTQYIRYFGNNMYNVHRLLLK